MISFQIQMKVYHNHSILLVSDWLTDWPSDKKVLFEQKANQLTLNHLLCLRT